MTRKRARDWRTRSTFAISLSNSITASSRTGASDCGRVGGRHTMSMMGYRWPKRPSIEKETGMAAIIAVNDLTKFYGRTRGIEHVTCNVDEGEIFGFLGPNGAGKTTTIRILMGLLHPTGGGATIGGHDVWRESVEVKKIVGYLPSDPQLEPDLTGGQIIDYFSHLRGGVDQAYVKSLVDRFE